MNDIPDFVRANAAKLRDSILATEKETEVAKPAMAAAKPLSVPPNVVTPGIAAETGAGLKTLGTASKVFEFLGVLGKSAEVVAFVQGAWESAHVPGDAWRLHKEGRLDLPNLAAAGLARHMRQDPFPASTLQTQPQTIAPVPQAPTPEGQQQLSGAAGAVKLPPTGKPPAAGAPPAGGISPGKPENDNGREVPPRLLPPHSQREESRPRDWRDMTPVKPIIRQYITKEDRYEHLWEAYNRDAAKIGLEKPSPSSVHPMMSVDPKETRREGRSSTPSRNSTTGEEIPDLTAFAEMLSDEDDPLPTDINSSRVGVRFPQGTVDFNPFTSISFQTSTNNEIRDALRGFLTRRGITSLPTDRVFIPFTDTDPEVSANLKNLKLALGPSVELGLFRLRYRTTATGGVDIKFCTCVKINGTLYRLLSPNAEKWGSQVISRDGDLEAELNKVFLPSKVRTINGNRYILPPIIENIEHPITITRSEYNDLISRLSKSKVRAHTHDLSKLDPDHPNAAEENLVRYNGKLYLIDAGEVFEGDFQNNPTSDEEVQYARNILKSRIRP